MAITRTLYRGIGGPSVLLPGIVMMAGKFTSDATGQVTEMEAEGFTFTRTGGGAYSVDLLPAYGVLTPSQRIAGFASVLTEVGPYLAMGAVDIAGDVSGHVMDLITFDATAPTVRADPPEGAIVSVWFFVAKNPAEGA